MKRSFQLFLLMGIFSFFSSRGQQSKVENSPRMMSDTQKETYRKALQRNEALPFEQEFVRTTDLAFSLLSNYGFDAVTLIFEDRNSENFFPLGSFPEDCPWYRYNSLNQVQFLQQNFTPIADKIPDLLAAMKERCWFIYAEKRDSSWQLHYLLKMKLYDNRDYYRVYTGGPPNPDARANEHLLKYQWELPLDLKHFYQVHDGFGETDDANFLLNQEGLRVMAEEMQPICEEQGTYPEGYAFSDLLQFFPDGSGNAQCFFRMGNNKYATVDWDHESWEITEPVGFFTFINQRLSVIDEE